MADCIYDAGIASECGYGVGGFRKIWFAPKATFTSAQRNAAGTITGLTMSGSSKFHPFQFSKNTGQWIEAVVVNGAQKTVTQTINLQFPKRSQVKKAIWEDVALAESVALLLDNDNQYWLIGETAQGLECVPTYDTGTASTDANIWSAVFTGNETQRADQVTSAAVTAVIATS